MQSFSVSIDDRFFLVLIHCIAERSSSRKPISRIVNRTSLRASRALRFGRLASKQGHDMWGPLIGIHCRPCDVGREALPPLLAAGSKNLFKAPSRGSKGAELVPAGPGGYRSMRAV